MEGREKSKQRVTVAFFVNAAGGKEPPIVIWKSEKPWCFKGVDKTKLPVTYFSQPKSWMTGDILDKIPTKLNHRLSARHQSILLLMDNVGCHPPEYKEKYSNIKETFLSPNTTSKVQPFDLGIIQNFKVYYRRLLLRYVLAKIDSCTSASDVVKSDVDLLTAIRWIPCAWDQVKPGTISRCFRKEVF